ncbi:MAG: type II/IV secretion system protein [Gemmatimonadaceae bacterium]|nr:type II/IV secretion system protein [Gemmatimonadaceae bacterium]
MAATRAASLDSLDEIGVEFGREVCAREVDDAELDRLIEQYAASLQSETHRASTGAAQGAATDVRDQVEAAPVVRYVNLLLRFAIDQRASDVHLELGPEQLAVRVRVDGSLRPAPDAPPHFSKAVVSRVKLLADLDISDVARPQDGRMRIRLDDRDLDIRVGTLPSMFGESVVLRVLDRGSGPGELRQLGMPPEIETRVRRIVERPHGLLLVTGPTGSGKTSTLYSALRLRDASREKLVTVEDPVEYRLAGVTQVPVNRSQGVTFAAALRSILRQDPDVILVGEMRDAETAALAVQAALTGHLVLSTLHTNDAVAAVPRLLDLGVPPYLIAATLLAVVGQRLVRRPCPSCHGTTRKGSSRCTACAGSGYQGRIGLFELLEPDDRFRERISSQASVSTLRELAKQVGYEPLTVDGERKVSNGQTTAEEVQRVAMAE